MSLNQDQPVDLAVARQQYRRKKLQAALLAVAFPLKTRPGNRQRFDDLAREDAAVRIAWVDTDVDLCRAALAAAREEGPAVFAEVRERVADYLAAKERATLDGFRDAPTPNLGRVVCEVAKEHGEAVAAVVALAQHPSHAQLEVARREVRQSIEAGEDALLAMRTDVVCAAPRRAAMR